MKVFALDASGDLLMQDNRILVPCNTFGKAVATRLRNRFLLTLGTWFLDTSKGFPWGAILGTKPDIPAARALFRRWILDCPGIARLDTLNVTYEGSTRDLLVDFIAFAVDGSRIEGLDPLLVNGEEVAPPTGSSIGGSDVGGFGVGVGVGTGGSIT